MENDEEIDLGGIFSMILRHIKLIIILILLFIILGVIYVKVIKVPEYTSSATLILVSKNSSSNDSATNSTTMATDLSVNSRLVSTYSELIKSKTVLRQVEENLGIDQNYEETLRKNISVTSESNTELIKISVTDKDPKLAYNVANEITKVSASKVQEIYNINNVHIVDNAKIPNEPSNDDNTKEILLSAVIGLIVAILYIVLKNAFDTTIKDENEVEKICSTHVIAMIPIYDNKMAKGGKK